MNFERRKAFEIYQKRDEGLSSNLLQEGGEEEAR